MAKPPTRLCWIGCAASAATFAALAVPIPIAADDAQVSRQSHAGSGIPAGSKAAYLKFAGDRIGQERSDNELKMKLVWCPPGQFTMEGIVGAAHVLAPVKDEPKIDMANNDDEIVEDDVPLEPEPRLFRRVEQITRVKTFLRHGYWIGKYEVTQSEWKQVMGSEPWKGEEFVKNGVDYPATYLSWDDATAFCRKLTEQESKAGRLSEVWEYTLPTEAQWERACRAGSETRYGFGDDELKLGEHAWFISNTATARELYPHRVGQKTANPWGLCDMHGNVWEWCRDCYREYPPGGFDPEVTTGAPGRVFRGGGRDDSPPNCRPASRKRNLPSWLGGNIGFRVALTVVH